MSARAVSREGVATQIDTEERRLVTVFRGDRDIAALQVHPSRDLLAALGGVDLVPAEWSTVSWLIGSDGPAVARVASIIAKARTAGPVPS